MYVCTYMYTYLQKIKSHALWHDSFTRVPWPMHMCDMTNPWIDTPAHGLLSHMRMNHITRVNESRHACECVMSHKWMRHITRIQQTHQRMTQCPKTNCMPWVNESCHTNITDTPAHDATAKNQLYALKTLVQCCPSLIYGANNKGLRPIDLAQREEIKQFLKVCVNLYIYIHMNIFTYIYVQCVCVCVCAYVHSKKGLCWVRVVSQEAKTQNESCHRYEWVMFYIWMSRVTHMNESCSSYEWIMSDIWMSRVTDMNESCHRYEWVMSQIWMSHVTHVNEPWHTREWVTWNIRMSHVMHMNNFIDSFSCVSWLIHMCDVTHSYLWYDPFICVTRLIHMNNRCHSINQSCQTYGWLMSHIWTSHVTHMNEPCYTYE